MSGTSSTFLVLFALLAAAHLAAADKYEAKYYAILKGANERPKPVKSVGFGTSELEVYKKYAEVTVSVGNLDYLQVIHVHFTGANQTNPNGSGPPVLWVVPFTPFTTLNPFLTVKGVVSAKVKFTGADLVGDVYPTNASADDKLVIFKKWAAKNQLYINAHTVKYPAGEIRGNFAKK